MARSANVEKARQYGTAYAKATVAGAEIEAVHWWQLYLKLPASNAVRLAFEWAAEDARANAPVSDAQARQDAPRCRYDGVTAGTHGSPVYAGMCEGCANR